jgi:hypothetical protein
MHDSTTTTPDNWHDYLHQLLTSKGQFHLIETIQKAQTTTLTYLQQRGDKETLIKLGYLENGRLITFDITNPKTPGHNAEQIEYFYENDFDKSKKAGRVGLQFLDVNQQAITLILGSGLKGTEKKYFINDKLHFSKVAKPMGNSGILFEHTQHFAVKSFWLRLLFKLIKPKPYYTVVEIELDKIFAGVAYPIFDGMADG